MVTAPGAPRAAPAEVGWWAGHLALYPLGVLGEQVQAVRGSNQLGRLGPVQRGLLLGDLEAALTPVLLVHGFLDNRAVFTRMQRALRRRGFESVSAVNYPLLTGTVEGAAVRLAAAVEEVCERTGHDRVHLVGHSLGGLVARWYVQRAGGDARVSAVVTLGTPHGGTLTAPVVPLGIARELAPDSSVIRALAEPAPGCRTPFTAIWSDLDQIVRPAEAGRIDHPDLACTNVCVRGVGHLSLPNSRAAVRAVELALSHQEQ